MVLQISIRRERFIETVKHYRENGLKSRFLRKKKLLGFAIDDYMEYLKVIRIVAEKVTKEGEVEFTPRDVDKALWQEDKENGDHLVEK